MGDLFARYGGEEFAVLLPETNSGEVFVIAERILKSVRDLKLPHPDSPFEIVTISIGSATINIDNQQTPSAFIEQADEALYEAKNKGRNTKYIHS